MATAVLAVTAVGPMVTLQDRGRRALMRFGVPASGPMDPVAFAIAQAALGNAPAEAEATAIDVSLGGLTLDCREGRVSVAVAGGGFRVSLDGGAHQGWGVHALQAGSRRSLRPGSRSGCRSFVRRTFCLPALPRTRAAGRPRSCIAGAA